LTASCSPAAPHPEAARALLRTCPGAIPTHVGSKANVSSLDKDIKVEKAAGTNAYTVGEVYAKRASLHAKQVAVKGKVVKFSQGIMGKNWVHIQDGSGNQQKGTHNLVATTLDTAAVGDIVTVTGTFAKDKDSAPATSTRPSSRTRRSRSNPFSYRGRSAGHAPDRERALLFAWPQLT